MAWADIDDRCQSTVLVDIHATNRILINPTKARKKPITPIKQLAMRHHRRQICVAKSNSGSQYLNYKGHRSIALMATYDARSKVVVIDVGPGAFGSYSNGGIFQD
ncbi:hypothetical protein PoB_004162900 [Plakobranchus ocellatus]|uniref:Uncharacterized protein n=1 Tax=Plakobranchus ocellatus TaxID=259542 RepID=A0AAV4B4V7_9GAST|nr:hypothetical protein PoB_004162900 [Plakobranchus ocellatus]